MRSLPTPRNWRGPLTAGVAVLAIHGIRGGALASGIRTGTLRVTATLQF
jgi:hypothetical protein